MTDSIGKGRLRAVGLSLREWFRYSERERFDPTAGATITTQRLTHQSRSDQEHADWEQEEWSVRAFLVPLDVDVEDAPLRAAAANSAHDVDFTPYWPDARTFDFGEASALGGVTILPWVHVREHPLTGELVIEPRADFLQYHCLDRREVDGAVEYVHPRDGIVALRTSVDTHHFLNPTPHVTVHRDYLRDYLAAKRAALVISVVADRFAHALNDTELQLEVVEDEPIGEYTSVTTTLHSATDTWHGFAMGRSSLYWNLVVWPYVRPRVRRSQWLYHGRESDLEDDDDVPPTFIADAEGGRCRAGAPGCPAYLYVRPQVLDKYLTTPGYGAAFHMRTWGGAWGPGDNSVDVGINSKGLITAFAADIADLPVRDQQHWAQYSSLSDGEVCAEMYQTRMQQRPPHSPSVPDLVANARAALTEIFKRKFGAEVYRAAEPLDRDRQRISVGPVRGDLREVVDLAKPLYAWVVESLETKGLRSPLDAKSVQYEKTARQIVLLRTVLTAVAAMPEADVRALIAPLVGLNDLRVASAHSLDHSLDGAFRLLGLPGTPSTPRQAWDGIVDSVVDSLKRIASALG
jgi:hypothetical protein